MRTLLSLALGGLAVISGCSAAPAGGAAQFDAQYEYGYFAGTPQRPDPFD